MAVIHREVSINAEPAHAWAKVADLGDVHRMLSFLTDATVEGDRRTCGLATGGQLSEIILSKDPDHRRLAYAIVQSPFQLEFHTASMTVVEADEGSTLVWTTDLKSDAAVEQVAGMIDGELDNVAAFLSDDRSS